MVIMARPDLSNFYAPSDRFLEHFKRTAPHVANVPSGHSIEALAMCALARYRQGTAYDEEVNAFIDAVVSRMTLSPV